jgi:hypothetical protein
LPITAVDSIPLALEHTKEQLSKPFRLGQWTKLALVGLLAGELGNGFSRSNFQIPPHGGGGPHIGFPGPLGIHPALLALVIASLIVAAVALVIILTYVSSVMRFVLFDSVVSRECHIRQGWGRRLGPGWRYFIWKLLFLIVTLATSVILLGIPAAIALATGWLREPKQHLPALILGGILLFCAFFAFFVVAAIVLVLTKDFVIPQMALEDIDAFEGWRRLLPMMKAEKGAFAAYIATKIALAIVASILIGIAAVILGVIFAIPTVALSILAILTGKAGGLTWNVYTITLAVVVGCILLALFLYLVSLVSVPVIVFFPAFSLYFFAARYPRLILPLYPASRAAAAPPGILPSTAPPPA